MSHLRIPQLKERWHNIPRNEEVVIALCQTPHIQLHNGRAYVIRDADAAILDYYRRMEQGAMLKHDNRKVIKSRHFLELAEKYRQRRESLEAILKGLDE